MLLTEPRRLILLLAVSLAGVASLAFVPPDDPLEKIMKALTKWQDYHITESVYLQTDKPFYAAGDTLWFKSYVTLGARHQLSALSGVLYVQLTDISGTIKQQIKLPINGGSSWGDFALPDSLAGGIYSLRAYTNYMRNGGEETFFKKTLFIGNSADNNFYISVTHPPAAGKEEKSIARRLEIMYPDGRPCISKKVLYSVIMGGKTILSGEKETDLSGGFEFLIPAGESTKRSRLQIMTKIMISENKVISKGIFFTVEDSKPDISFMPEGGDMVANIAAKVAFKVIGANGLGLYMEGKLLDESNSVVTNLKTSHLGMGVFNFTPLKGRAYKANLKDSLGNYYTVPLPKVLDKGCVMSLENRKDNFEIHINSNLGLTQDQHFLLIAQADGEIYFAAKSNGGTGAFEIEIPKNKFPSGVIQFTLFSSSGEPLCERLVFVRNATSSTFSIISDKKNYETREKVSLSVRPIQGVKNTTSGSFSVAVTSEALVQDNKGEEPNIFTSLLLNSPLKGFIEEPDYYFNNITEETDARLDLLMLTQGFRRFEWRKILNDDFPVDNYKPEKSLEIAGFINYRHRPLAGAKVSLFKAQAGAFYRDTVTNDQGRFSFEDLVYTDTGKFVLQAATADGKRNVDIILDTLSASKYNQPFLPLQTVGLPHSLPEYLKNNRDEKTEVAMRQGGKQPILLKNVVIKERRINPYLKHSSNLNGSGNADQVITAEQLTSGGTLAEALLSKLRFVNIIHGKAIDTRGNTPMAIVMDGTFVPEDMLTSIPSANVASVEVLRDLSKTAVYGARGSSGIILITSKTGDIPQQKTPSEASPGVKPYSQLGYYLAKEFYSPIYRAEGAAQQTPDRRSTIYWNPNLVADEQGNINFDFYNADIKGRYKVTIEGINVDGVLSRKIFTYQVN